MMDHSERMMRQAISDMPDGSYTATTHLDGFVDSEDPARRDLPITVTVTVAGSDVTVDFTGTADQVADRPINMPFEGTTDCAVWLTLKSILLDSDVHGNIPQNSGMIRPITIIAPEGSLVNPVFPAPTIARFCTGNQAADTVMKALAQAVPEKVSAGVGNLHVVSFSGLRGGEHWVHMEIHEGCYGGRLGKDGMDAVDTLYANTRNNPIEDTESHLPLRVVRYELRDDACPPGRWRGGIGSLREVEFLEDGGVSVEGEGHVYAPWGFDGGSDGNTASMGFSPVQGNRRGLPSKLPNLATRKGDRIEVVGPCGGGYGNPFERDPAQVLEDVLDGYLSVQQARDDYGVVISDKQEIDIKATSQARA
jgi:N-methylhydantoinase B